MADIIRQDPNVLGLVSTVGGQAANTLGGPNLGQIVVHLKPRGERTELATDIIAKLRPQLARVPGTLVFMQNPPTFGALVTLILFGMDPNIYAFVGMIMLIGIVEKNAIMQIDFALEAERSGMTPEKAIARS